MIQATIWNVQQGAYFVEIVNNILLIANVRKNKDEPEVFRPPARSTLIALLGEIQCLTEIYHNQ